MRLCCGSRSGHRYLRAAGVHGARHLTLAADRLARGGRPRVLPYHDENKTQRTPIVTVLFVLMNVAAWVLVQGAGAAQPLVASVCSYGLIPGELTGQLPAGIRIPLGEGMACVTTGGAQLNLLTSMFMHGSWLHLLGNMWFLWLFGNNIEDSMTRPRFIVFYLLCGLAAAVLQVVVDPASGIPMVGASGAISGVMGAYLVLYPTVRVYTLVPIGFLITSLALPAWVMLIYWGLIQLLGGFTAIGAEGGGVAFWAHVGGFVAGMVLVKLFARPDHVRSHRTHHWRPQRVGW
jgi:membrane associated rhomboid family serine protease